MLHILRDSLQKAQGLIEHNGHGDLGQLLEYSTVKQGEQDQTSLQVATNNTFSNWLTSGP